MMVMTAKVDLKKVMLILAALAAGLLCLIFLFGGEDSTPTAAPALSSNDGRVKYLTDLGWDVTTSPAESSQVKIPKETSEVFTRYNALQKSQGFDLSQYAGKTAMRYVYKVNNYPNATAPVYATLLLYKNEVIGGDITDTSPGGKLQGLKSAPAPAPSTAPSTAASDPSPLA